MTIGFFGHNVVFITVSQSPNLKGLLQTMWENMISNRKPEYQRTGKTRQSKPTLVVVDYVWSRIDLDILLFEAEGYKTFFTTRDYELRKMLDITRDYSIVPKVSQIDFMNWYCWSWMTAVDVLNIHSFIHSISSLWAGICHKFSRRKASQAEQNKI